MKKLFAGFVLSVFLLLAAVSVLFLTQQRVALGFLASPVARVASALTGSEFTVEGNYYLTLGKWLVFAMDSGAVEVKGKDGSRLSAAISTFETTIHLPSLVKRRLVLDGLTLAGMRLDWYPADQQKQQTSLEKYRRGSTSALLPSALRSLGEISLADIVIRIFPAGQKVPIEYQVKKVTGNLTAGSAGQLAIDGVVDEKALTVSVETGQLANLGSKTASWPFSVQLGHKSLAALIRGQAAMVDGTERVEADFSLRGDHWDDLASLYGGEGSTNTPFAVEGKVELAGRGVQLQISKIEPGGENLLATAAAEDYGLPDARYRLKVAGGSLNLDAIHDLIARPERGGKNQGPGRAAKGMGRDTALLPAESPVSDLALDLALDRLVVADKQVANLRLNAVIEDGIIAHAPFSAVFKNASLAGYLSIDRQKGMPHIAARLMSESFDVGTFLSDFHLAEGVEMKIAGMSTDFSTRGRAVGELLEHLTFTTTAKEGISVLQDINTGAKLPLHLSRSTISAAPGAGLHFELHGQAHQSPFAIAIHFGDPQRNPKAAGRKEVSFSAVIAVDANRFEFDGRVPVPIRLPGTTLKGRMSSRQLSDFNKLLHLHLPRIGPVTLAGTLQIVPEGYRLEGVELDVGTSSLAGSLTVQTAAGHPELTADLLAEKIQLDDFRVASDLLADGQAAAEPAELPGDKAAAAKKVKTKKSLADQEILNKLNARIKVEVGDVFSGRDNLGRGRLAITLQNGRLDVRPLHLELPGGGVEIALSVQPGDDKKRYTLSMDISHLDYGTVGRWLKPDTDMKGVVSIRTSLEAKSVDFKHIMASANGYVDFYIHPEQLRAGVIDLWTVNLLLYLMPILAPGDDSVINCAAGRFRIVDGLLSQEDLLIDTSQMQVTGTVAVDFSKNRIDAILKPKAKSAQFLSLATPLEIRGDLSSFETGVPSGALLGAVVRNMSSMVVVPLQWIFQEKMPRDGTAFCRDLFEKPRP